MPTIIIASTDRVIELETLNDELIELQERYVAANTEGKRIVRHQIRQIERDIRHNRANLGEKT